MATTYCVRYTYTMFINNKPVDVCDGWDEFDNLEDAQVAAKEWESKTYVYAPRAIIQQFPKK